jgi:hypothetical protein
MAFKIEHDFSMLTRSYSIIDERHRRQWRTSDYGRWIVENIGLLDSSPL